MAKAVTGDEMACCLTDGRNKSLGGRVLVMIKQTTVE